MNPSQRIAAFAKLGEDIRNLSQEELAELAWRAGNNNSWFTEESIAAALQAIGAMVSGEKLAKWVSPYALPQSNTPKSIGLLMAGNIPAVGFHDLMCVLIAGHQAVVKLSSTDEILMGFLVNRLIAIEGGFAPLIRTQDMLKGMDAYIATGSDNSSRYFNYYFGKYPHIIRQNRTSVAVLTGNETTGDFVNLGKDIFKYFGLGCRNVSKIYVKSKDQLQFLLDALEVYSAIGNHHKYRNNYDYNKSVYLVNREEHLDNGFLLVKESTELVSPIAVLYYQLYDTKEELELFLGENSGKIQSVVGGAGMVQDSVSFGQAQQPELWEYADGVDTLRFLIDL